MRSRLEIYSYILLFFAEFTYYLLILQTGVVAYHHSQMTEIWMMPVGGIVGILSSIRFYRYVRQVMPFALGVQMLISMHYPHIGHGGLFLLGVISGVTAPLLIYHIKTLWIGVLGLLLSYMAGTLLFHVDAEERMWIAVGLSCIALVMSLVTRYEHRVRSVHDERVTFYTMGGIFAWLLLDAILFETLSRDAVMHLWGSRAYLLPIIVFHTAGLVTAFYLRRWEHNDVALIVLFLLAYGAYGMQDRHILSVVYPFVISYYNVIILMRLNRLGYPLLAIMSLSLWGASGMGLFTALYGSIWLGWFVLFLLFAAWLLRFVAFKPACRFLDGSIVHYQ